MPDRPPLPGIPRRHLPDRREPDLATEQAQPRAAVPPAPGSSPESASVPKAARAPESRRSVFARGDLSTLWSAAGRWSPAGIAAAILLVFLALGGREGVVALARGLSDSMSGARELTAEIVALRTSLDGLSERLDLEREQRQNLSAEVERTQKNLSLVCDLAAELNAGRPHRSWCSEDDRSVKFDGPPAGEDRIPRLLTSAKWSHRAQPP